ncbi:hypothetical protein HZC21_04595 [Candidatus Peregrinibacteria bacterium]|nr:hypothetical protein [Candidatus Peregrinibacteria bacterium]
MYLQNLKKHPYSLFWIGILVGAIVTGILFWYRIYSPTWDTAILKTPTYKIQQQKQQKKGSLFQFKKPPATKSSSKKGSVDESNPSPGI